MLCALCSNLQLFGRKAKHHTSYRTLLDSAKSGCEFCTLIFQRDLVKRGRSSHNDLEPEPTEDSAERRWDDGEKVAGCEDRFLERLKDEENDGWIEDSEEDSQSESDDEEDEENEVNCGGDSVTQIYYTMYASHFERGCIEFTQPGGLGTLKEEFFYWVKNDDPLSGTMGHLERYVEPDPSSTISLSFETNWLHQCLTSHATCPPDQDYPLPTRVLDLGPPSSSSTPYLLISNSRTGKYVALSHCWGGELPLSTITSTLASRQAGIPFSEFPKTFQDAITITKRLGYQYLWIDSLCIIQDDKSDWAAEAAKMGTVYKHSALTISANIAANPHVGILQPRDLDKVLELPCFNEENKVVGHLQVKINTEPKYNAPPADEQYDFTGKRGWTLQEDRLSPRTLRFKKWGKQWVCHSALLEERRPYAAAEMPAVSPDKVDAVYPSFLFPENNRSKEELEEMMMEIKLNGPNFKEIWYSLLTDFMARSLTFKSDTFPAFGGLAREVQKMNGWEYKAGLWREDFYTGLLWVVGGRGQATKHYVAPSWSWGSLVLSSGGADYFQSSIYLYSNFIEVRGPELEAKIVDVFVENTHEDPFGEVKSASLTIRGLWKDADDSLLGHAMTDNMAQPRMKYKDPSAAIYVNSTRDTYEMVDVLRDEHRPLLSFDCLSDDEFKKSRAMSSFPPPYGVTGNSPDFWSKFGLLQILKGSRDGEVYNPKTDTYEKVYEWVHFALMLEPTGVRENEFKRIGVAQIPDFEGMGTEGWVMREVTIV
ncbi:uncharacterized protein PAC_02673 [Phialocephala subalpina]|uniref:Heterokaryon incompatibility domain-containing protein n=1 Tax=Phialocephala subalpina TaxID=576137 RepID=A0A1L7WJ63_9HELO|nr:uncharacterized protein PAC_02673 [Phialocephala subalpina]